MNYNILRLDYDTNCTAISINKWNQLMNKSVKANGKKIRALIKKYLPDLYEQLVLDFPNPYEHQCRRTKTHFIYIHSGIEYFLKFN
jgi:hypothetical protein